MTTRWEACCDDCGWAVRRDNELAAQAAASGHTCPKIVSLEQQRRLGQAMDLIAAAIGIKLAIELRTDERPHLDELTTAWTALLTTRPETRVS